MTDEPAAICPCQEIAHPRVIDNPPGRTAIRYRAGDYGSFRDALLRSLPDERELLRWRPTADGDLALQLFEWWAYLADILTFYNEQIARGAYLGTAFLPGSVEQIVRLIGYRPLPGIGAHGTLAALVSGPAPVQLPAGFAVQSKPGPPPADQPKVFELAAGASALPGAAGGVVPLDVKQATLIHGRTSLVLRGKVTSLKAGDLVVVAGTPATAANSQAITIASVRFEKDPRGRTNSRVSFAPALTVPDGDVTAYRVLRSDVALPIYPYAPASTAIEGPAAIHLASAARSIGVGDLVLIESSSGGGASYTTAVVSGAREQIWYANADDTAGHPELPPTAPKVAAFPVPHAVLTLGTLPPLTTTRVWFGFRAVADLLDEPAGPTITGTAFAFTPLAALDPGAAIGQRVLLEDATGAGALGRLATPPSPDEIRVTTDAAVTLTLPVRLLGNLIDVTEGKTVAGELLGDGDPTAAGQTFTLQKSPLTYLAGSDPSFPTSTLTVTVDAVAWTEVKSFYGQGPTAQVYVTRQDADRKTHVLFGDGVSGARLPRGAGNVRASYRFGSGLPAPAAGSIATILKPVPGLASVRNPVGVSGADDPTPPSKIRRYAPRTVLTFGRAVSAADYEAIAANAPSVTRARAYYSWDGQRQRATVVVYVGDDRGAADAAQLAIDSARDPNLPAKLVLATPIQLDLTATVAYDARFDQAALLPQVIAALAGDAGLFSPDRIRIGEPLYDSQIYAACLAVAGTVAVRGLALTVAGVPLSGVRHKPGEGGFFTAAAADIHLTLEAL
jgi:predicted phage baseplate assembly protein